MTPGDRDWLGAHRRRIVRRHVFGPAIVAGVAVAALLLFGEWTYAALIAGLVVAGIAVARRIAEAATAPLGRVSETARSMAAGNLDAHVPSSGDVPPALSSALIELRDQMRRRVGALEAEERKLRSVLDGLPDAVFLLEDGRVGLANAAAERLFRRPAGGWEGTRLEDLLPASLGAALAATAGREAVAVEECGPDPSGRCLRATLLRLEAPPAHSLAIVSDITERATVDAIRRDFVANASHELKTPAAGILLLAESAEAAISDGAPAEALAFVSRIAEEATRLRRLVLDLLDLSRLEAAPGPVEGMTDIRHAVDLALSGHRASAAERGLELRVEDEAAGRDLFASADRTDVAVALDNLLDNALTYTEHGSVTLTLGVDDDSVRVTVADTGLGIPAEELPRVFERFYRVDRARSRESGGTGLGLALVKHVVERSGGSVSVSSEPGVGSRFAVALPRAR